ncbi:ditrans,polycis-undecaprenyl-diphosphate synthase [Moorella thermoacetica]|uniref:Isoprenyl transferase n=1 Tax=Neomoorella thermoacetica TaxID=1525 RepID=A0A1J5NUD0_NEOTH|nr:ditrans,polycis-undecaprenyl-diphosphate synthase [Moorella thermoacetica]
MFSFLTKRFHSRKAREDRSQELDRERLPRHLAIIMDGNGRWARSRGLPRLAGHRAGVESLRDIVRACVDWGIGILTVYAFSTENWKRPHEEVEGLMNLLVEYLRRELAELQREGVQVRAIGRLESLPQQAREELERARKETAANTRLILNLALNYGGRSELVDACRRIATLVARGELEPQEIDEEVINNSLYTAGLPDPDLLIRPSGELRVSNFLLWQLAYTEFWVTDIYWPDFRREDLRRALLDYQQRERRFGGLKI